MKKVILIISMLLVSTLFFAKIYNFNILNGTTNVGTITSIIEDSGLYGGSIVEMFLSGTKMKFMTRTDFNSDWSFKEYSVEVQINDKRQFILKSVYDGKNVINELTNQMKFPAAPLLKGIILDNNFIFEHYYALLKNNVSGNINFFVPTSSINNPKLIPMKGTIEKTDKLIKLNTSGIMQNINIENNEISSIEIPSQNFKVVPSSSIKSEAPKKFTETECTFVSNEFTLSGTISAPKDLKNIPLPAIVLVHGSGPNDRNEQIPGTPYRPFYDLATRLSENGFVVLRYDKRTYTLMQKGLSDKHIMPQDIIGDAQAAVNYLKTIPAIDKNRIYVIGHSEGAGFLPHIVKDLNVKGAIALAPNLLPISQIMVYQMNYQLNYFTKKNTDGTYNELVDMLKKYSEMAVDSKKKLDSGELKDNDMMLGFQVKYIKEWDMLGADNPGLFSKMPTPVLYINGTSDLKCPFEIVRENEKILMSNKKLKLVYIPAMGHELYQTDPEFYFENRVVEEIVNWINNN